MFAEIDWNAVGAVGQWAGAVATMLGVVVALGVLFYAIYHDYWRRPKLIFSFDNNLDVKTQTNTVNPQVPGYSRWLRVRIVNAKRRKTAKNCRAYLNRIDRVQQKGGKEDAFPNDNRPMGWTHDLTGPQTGRDPLPGVIHWVDVAFTVQGENGIGVCVAPPYALANPGVYDFTIQVSCEDADPEVITIRVCWDGTWESLRGERAATALTA